MRVQASAPKESISQKMGHQDVVLALQAVRHVPLVAVCQAEVSFSKVK